MKTAILALAALAALGPAAGAARADTLADVKAKGFVQCGVAPSTPGFALPDADNSWSGMDVDYCRAMAAAIFNNADAVRYTPLSTEERFTALSGKQVDVLSRTSTWTMGRDTSLGITFVGATYYDGQGFMVRKADNITSASQLSGSTICIEKDTTTELNAEDYFSSHDIDYKPLEFDTEDETVKAFVDGRCNVFSSDASALAGERSLFSNPDDYIILPEIISKEPLGPAVRQGDPVWFNISRWTYFALLDAEELGVTSKNVDEMLGSDNAEIKRLLGVEDDFGSPIGLDKDWAYRIVKLVGNYAEIFNRDVGPDSPLKLPRGLNALWKDGGIQYAPPIR
ncbi:MAG TPA: amino acid ABC transporter substrate-binding protein [Devosia sp.]|nr:amino acid ABC transporter substrate-binding protein [Devosia sp.]